MSLVFAVLAILVVAGAALAASGRWPGGAPGDPDRRPDVDGGRFDVVFRGYRMDAVDARIARLESELAQARSRPGNAGHRQ